MRLQPGHGLAQIGLRTGWPGRGRRRLARRPGSRGAGRRPGARPPRGRGCRGRPCARRAASERTWATQILVLLPAGGDVDDDVGFGLVRGPGGWRPWPALEISWACSKASCRLTKTTTSTNSLGPGPADAGPLDVQDPGDVGGPDDFLPQGRGNAVEKVGDGLLAQLDADEDDDGRDAQGGDRVGLGQPGQRGRPWPGRPGSGRR